MVGEGFSIFFCDFLCWRENKPVRASRGAGRDNLELTAATAQYALENDLTLKQAALKVGFVMEDEFDRVVDPAKMAHPEPLMPAENDMI
jgi:Fumarase C C-terminus